jgi:hypothetical protein
MSMPTGCQYQLLFLGANFTSCRLGFCKLLMEPNSSSFGIPRSIRVGKVDAPCTLFFASSDGGGLFDEIQGPISALGIVISNIRDHEVGFVIETKGREVFPVLVFGLLKFELAKPGAAMVYSVHNFFCTVVIDDPKDVRIDLGARQTARFADF